MKKTLLLIAAVVALAACQKIVEVPVEVEVEKIVDILTLNAAQLQVPNKAVEQPLSFTTEDSWTISSDADWITFDKTSGAKGSNNVTMKVAKSELYSTRTGRVTLSTSHDGTAKNTVFTVVQSENEVFNTSVDMRVDYTAQNIEIAWTSNLTPEVKVVEGDWLSVTQTKADPQDGKIVVKVAANEELDSRAGSFTVAAGGNVQTYNVQQASQYAAASSATALFLGNKQDMYDASSYIWQQFAQFAVQFATPEGDVTLALNVDPEIEDVAKIPAGEYTMDETGEHAAGTYSIKNSNPAIRYYTTVKSGDKEMEIIDGTINVTENGGVYAIVAELTDLAGATHLYSYKGELAATDESFGINVYSAKTRGQYYTYYTTKTYETILELQFNKPFPGADKYISYMTLNIFNLANDGNLPTGKFTFAQPENDATLGYKNGILQAADGTFYMNSCENRMEEWGSASYALKDGAENTLEITKQENGLYTFKFNMTVVRSSGEGDAATTEDIPLNTTISDVYCGQLSDMGMVPHPDGDFAFSSIMNSYYMPRWYGDAYNTGCKVFHQFGFNNVDNDYSIFLALNVKDDDWTFTNDMGNFCTTQFKVGTFTFSWTPGENTLLPIKNYHRIVNNYTGHTYIVNGGSITLTSDTISYDLTATYEGQTFHFGGSHAAQLYYIRNNSTSAAPALDPAPTE